MRVGAALLFAGLTSIGITFLRPHAYAWGYTRQQETEGRSAVDR
jgi:hypothetical protein